MYTQLNLHLANAFLALVLPAGVFDTRPADYVFMLLFNWICIVVSFFYLWKAEHILLYDLHCSPSTIVGAATWPLCFLSLCSTINCRSLLLLPFICLPFLPLSLPLCSAVPCHIGSMPTALPHSTPSVYKNSSGSHAAVAQCLTLRHFWLHDNKTRKVLQLQQ